MGNASGTYTQKATISSQLYPFSKWDQKEIHQLLIRGRSDLSESFGLRKHEVEYLIGINEEISFKLLRSLFEDVFDTDHNNLVDKMELMCVICMVSKISTADKLQFFFDLFNFNNKGFLNDSELTLLIMAVTRGVYKVDQKFTPPSAKVIKDLVNEAFQFAISEPGNLRKPELLRFAVSNPSVYAYLECWRGHASQVLLLDGTKWRDLSFPCDESAITWNYSWGVLGLPPPSFVHWRRIDHIGTEIVTSHLFAHELSYLKTVDRRKVYKGEGIIGKGYFKRGCLADLWFLNGLSALISNPELLLSCFGQTGQEENGRYCCRFYEGGSWRSVYVDDRIPCTSFLSPIFTTSSCKFEYWPLIMQKASAKYLGSYGHVAWCSDRTDASLMALRMLTGGHVKRYYIFHYDWKSVIIESVKESGTQFILDSLKKGHVISFLRSATQSMMNLSLKQNKSTLNLLPVGHFFPVVGYTKNQAGYIYLIFKDTWGLVADVNQDVDIETGRCNTFKIKIEDITMFFDCFVIAFYPDSLRSKTTKLGIKPWMTEASAGICNPATKTVAKYVLKVKRTAMEEKLQSSDNRFKGKHEIINDAILEANEIPKTEDAIHIPRLKEKANYIRETDRPMPGQSKSQQPTVKTTQITSGSLTETSDDFDDIITLAFTASSSYDWSYAGSQEAKPSIKVRIIPSKETKHFIRQREAELVQRKKLKQEYLQKRRMAQAQLLDVNTFGEGSFDENESKLSAAISNSEQNSLNGSVGKGGIGADLGEDSTSLLYRNPSVAEDKQYELFFSGERCWLSQNIQLVEGEYLVLIDLQFQQPLQEIKRRSLPRDLGEAPWVDYRIAKLLQHIFVVDQLNTEKFGSKLFDQDDDTRSLQSLKELEKRLFSDKNRDGKNIVDANNSANGTNNSAGVAATTTIPTGTDDIVPSDLEALMENKVWFECSSNDTIKLRPFDGKKKKDKNKFEVSEPVFPTKVQRETWPLTCESQLEIASIKLTEMMTEMKFEAQVLAEEFVSIARKYKEEKKLETMNQTGRGNKAAKGSNMK